MKNDSSKLEASSGDSPTIDTVLAETHQLILAGKPVDARKKLEALSVQHPADRDVRLALLEAAVLSQEWKMAAGQVRVLSPFREGEEPSIFYAAVALFESGQKDDARAMMKRAENRISRTRYTNYYFEKVLGH